MEKVTQEDGQSADIVGDNIEELKKLFPDAFKEGAVDFEALRQLLGDASVLEEGEEKYGLNWHGKKKARQIALTPSTGTLLPCPDRSANWEDTKNIFIEGDNLEVLKLLQKSYAGEVKLIYIDPPYNTDKDFIYPDRFSEGLETYLKFTGQKGEEGSWNVSESGREKTGRRHTLWLSMMYPRLRLAKNLLSSDGAIFISIDENELSNLIQICDEIFGAENRLGVVDVVSNLKGRSDDKYFATAHNSLVCYSKGDFTSLGVDLPEEYLADYPEIDADGRRFRLQGLRKRGSASRREDRPKMYYPFYVDPEHSTVRLEADADHTVEVFPVLSDGADGRWRWGRDTSEERLSELSAKQVGSDKRWDIFQIDLAEGEDGAKRIKPKSVWMGSEFANEAGTLQTKALFGKGLFDNPKPTGLIEYIIEQTCHDGIVLDFFAGSASTAHAVLLNNAKKGRANRYVMVQLPEQIDATSDAGKAGYKTISELSIARLEKSSKEVENDFPDAEIDAGYRVFKLERSNIAAWNPEPTDLEETLISHQEHLIADRSEQDLLYELLLKRGIDLAEPVESRGLDGIEVQSVGFGVLFACFANEIPTAKIDKIANGLLSWHKELEPETDTHVFFRDSAFEDDIAKTNMAAILEQNGITHVRSL